MREQGGTRGYSLPLFQLYHLDNGIKIGPFKAMNSLRVHFG